MGCLACRAAAEEHYTSRWKKSPSARAGRRARADAADLTLAHTPHARRTAAHTATRAPHPARPPPRFSFTAAQVPTAEPRPLPLPVPTTPRSDPSPVPSSRLLPLVIPTTTTTTTTTKQLSFVLFSSTAAPHPTPHLRSHKAGRYQ
ncbi:hypothetical protein PVAP13_9KG500126 [Panicum virgatum]|uniref:Uncharacterized protein n=1 Tax=Panicum virgatum TaxID=38727 RepID=A0A8T0NU14_PANVG|nr:hypothetical protein PVAP13_9KG500126 [Panicum virgatum]